MIPDYQPPKTWRDWAAEGQAHSEASQAADIAGDKEEAKRQRRLAAKALSRAGKEAAREERMMQLYYAMTQ